MNRHIKNISLALLISLLAVISLQSFAQAPNTWMSKAPFGGGVRSGAASFSINGKGYIGTGLIGNGAPRDNDFWEYDPSNDTWSQKTNFGGTPRYYATGFSIGNKGYIVCGYDGNLTEGTGVQQMTFGNMIKLTIIGQ